MIRISLGLCAQEPAVKIYPFNDHLDLLTVSPGKSEQIRPKAIFASLDVSYSMDNACKANDSENGGTDFSRLDTLRHALGVVISSLGEQDVFSLDYFDNWVSVGIEPSTVKDLGDFNDVIFSRIEGQVKGLGQGQTAMWRALEDIIIKAKSFSELHPEYDTQIIFLTDGQPLSSNGGDRPASGSRKDWSKVVAKSLGGSQVKINVVGISTESEKNVLESISMGGNGFLAYIHDGATVIDTIAHLIANIKTSLPDFNITMGGKKLEWLDFEGHTSNAVYHRRPGLTREMLILKGQFEDFPKAEMPADVRARLDLYGTLDGILKNSQNQYSYETVKKQSLDLVEHLHTSLSPQGHMHALGSLATSLFVPTNANDLVQQKINGILSDLKHRSEDKGQISRAIEAWNDWGEWYLISARSAYRTQIAVNGFDQAPQDFFISQEIASEITKAKEIGSSIKQPEPSLAGARKRSDWNRGFRTGNSASTTTTRTPNITDVGGGGCVGPETRVIMNDSSIKEVKDIQVGETLKSGAKVVLIVESSGLFRMAKHRKFDFFATQWHPVKLSSHSNWQFPAESDQFTVQAESQQRVFNLVLDKNHYVEIEGGLNWITLGHGNQEDSTLKHPFFADMKKIQETFLPMSLNGRVLVNNQDFKRDENTREIIGFTGENLLNQGEK
ncbi:MAG: hypothetical protein AB8G05_04900 [Oligoflexales bacterium]